MGILKSQNIEFPKCFLFVASVKWIFEFQNSRLFYGQLEINFSTVDVHPKCWKINAFLKSVRAALWICMQWENVLKAMNYDFKMKIPTIAVQHCKAITTSTNTIATNYK